MYVQWYCVHMLQSTFNVWNMLYLFAYRVAYPEKISLLDHYVLKTLSVQYEIQECVQKQKKNTLREIFDIPDNARQSWTRILTIVRQNSTLFSPTEYILDEAKRCIHREYLIDSSFYLPMIVSCDSTHHWYFSHCFKFWKPILPGRFDLYWNQAAQLLSSKVRFAAIWANHCVVICTTRWPAVL